MDLLSFLHSMQELVNERNPAEYLRAWCEERASRKDGTRRQRGETRTARRRGARTPQDVLVDGVTPRAFGNHMNALSARAHACTRTRSLTRSRTLKRSQ